VEREREGTMTNGRRMPKGRYACGCRTEAVRGRNGVVRMRPCCMWHGEALGFGTLILYRMLAFARRVGLA
jgi:hypothetical protein